MSAPQNLILTIGESEVSCKLLTDIIGIDNYNIAFANNIELAIKMVIKQLPDLIICFYEVGEYNGFQFYNILEDELLKNEIPFIIVFNQFRRNDLLVAVELGIDSYIYPPIERRKVLNIIEKQLSKIKKRKADLKLKFDSICKIIPYGIFVADSRRIVQTNQKFDALVNGLPKVNGTYLLNEVFAINVGNEDELKFSRFMNGLTKDCILTGIGIKGKNSERFNLNFSLIKKIGSSAKVVGILFPENEEEIRALSIPNHKNHINKLDSILLTVREQQILELSARGVPIKQIARQLGISDRTVEKHRSNVIRKTKCENIVEAVFMYGKQNN
jgi:two-component system alkaline phosphatase synthesis response regulator PhoP